MHIKKERSLILAKACILEVLKDLNQACILKMRNSSLMLVLGTRENIEIDIRFFNKNLAIMIKFLGS